MILYPNTLFVGKVCEHLPTVASTQTYLRNLYTKSRPAEGTAILSYNQTGGYGQRNASWQARPEAGVAISLIFYPAFLTGSNQFLLSMAMALAVKTAVRNLTGKACLIKWPNDIMVDGKKVSGILIETHISEQNIEYAIVGIGLNVKQQDFGDLDGLAASLEQLTGNSYDMDRVSCTLMEWVEKYYLSLRGRRYDEIVRSYNESLYRKDQWVELYDRDNEVFPAMIRSVDDHGRLIVTIEDGTDAKFVHGSIRIKY